MSKVIIIIIMIVLVLANIGLAIWGKYNSLELRKKSDLTTELVNKYNEIVLNKPVMAIQDRVKSTNQLFDLIDAMISLELINIRKFEIFLDNKTKNLDYDRVIEDTSKHVFEAIKPDVFMDKENIVTEEYLMSYIQKQTLIQYLTYLKDNVKSGS